MERPNQRTTNEVEEVFNRIDENHDGKISASELGKVVRALGSEASDNEFEAMIREMDSNRDGFVDVKEFAEFCRKKKDGEEEDGGLKDAFDAYDLNGNGVISAEELKVVMERLGEKLSVKDCEKMIGMVDCDGDGCVDFEEFRSMMTGGGMMKG